MAVDDVSAKDALPTGCRFHCYEFLAVLGSGSFGITYLAKDESLNKPVAIKEYFPTDYAIRDEGSTGVSPKNSQSTEIFEWGLKRFRDEAKTLANFSHPNIVKALTVFDSNNTVYLAMEYEAGKGLDELLRAGEAFSETFLLDLLRPLLDGLSHVHKAGFIHRDIKPSNILIRKDGSPVLIDFGSARKTFGNQTSALTSLITPGYAPFEQYDQENNLQGPWTDMYSMSATVYRLISGRIPVDSMARGIAIANNGVDPFVPLTRKESGAYSMLLLGVVNHGLAFKTEDRLQSAVNWVAEISVINAPLSSTKLQEESRTKGRNVAWRRYAIVFLLVTMIAGYGVNTLHDKGIKTSQVEGQQDLELSSELQRGASELQRRERLEETNALNAKAKIAFQRRDESSDYPIHSNQLKAGIREAFLYYRQALAIDPTSSEAREGVVSIAMFIAEELDALLLESRFDELESIMADYSGIPELTPLNALYQEKLAYKKSAIAKSAREEADRLAMDRLALEKSAKQQRETRSLLQEKEKLKLSRIASKKKRRSAQLALINQQLQLLQQAVEAEDIALMKQLSGGGFPLEHFFVNLFSSYQSIHSKVRGSELNKLASKSRFRLEINSLENNQNLPVIPAKAWRIIEGEIIKDKNGAWVLHWKAMQ
ncbi:MAG: serine/threonine protein kinase [Pseudomonadales bacterium]|nr:serine/threonine protein kinase [Pseudomonadales bacterium]